MRKIYIDCGSHDCKTVDDFEKKHEGFELFAFEPNDDFWELYNGKDLTLIKKAVWIDNCKKSFYKAKDDVGSTLLENKISGGVDYSKSFIVDCIDFDQWIVDNFQKDNYIYLHMDIEGAEFEVLNKMMETGSIEYLNYLEVELHPNKITDYTTTYALEMIERLKKYDFGLNLLRH